MKIVKVLLVVFILSYTNIFGVVTRNFSSSTKGFYNNAIYDGVMLTEQGALTLAPKVKKESSIDGKHIWKIYPADNGDLFAAISGSGAEIYKKKSGEENFNLFVKSTNDSAFTSVISDKSGNIYATTAPYAVLYKYDANGNEIWSKTLDDTYVWDMKFDKNDNLYLACGGDNARVLKVSANGSVSQVIKTDEQHAMSLYYDSKNNVMYVGTAGRGLVLSIDLSTNKENPTHKVVHDTAQNEVYAITMDNIGNLYFGTATREASYLILPSILDGNKKPNERDKEFRNSLYKADSKGTVQRLFFLNQTLVFALSSDKDNNIYFITGDSADIYKINGNDGLLSYIGGLKNKTLSTFAVANDGLYFAISKTGEVYKIDSTYPTEGVFTSDTLDLRVLSKLGSFSAMSTIPDGANIELAVRTGNVARIDSSWSEFSTVNSDGKVSVPDGRFLQFKVTMKTSDTNTTPILSSLDFTYVENNLAPDVLNAGLVSYYKQQTSTDAVKTPALEDGESMIYWKGSDPNGDKLVYNIDYRLKGEKNYRVLATNLETAYFRFKSYLLASGIYDFRITASDRLDNAIENAKTKTLEVFNVKHDNEAPEIIDFKVSGTGNNRLVSFSVRDNLSFLKSIRYSDIYSNWFYVLPTDGVLDSTNENFELKITDSNISSITIEVSDIEGNIKYYSFVI